MPIFGATHSCRIAYQLRSRGISIPWFPKTDVRACLKGRVYSSAVPVRYKPKKKRDSPLLDSHSPPASTAEKIDATERPGSNPVGLEVFGGGNGGQNQIQKPFLSPYNSQNQCKLPLKLAELEEEFGHDVADYGRGQKVFVSTKKSQNQCNPPVNDSGYGFGQKAFVSAKKSQNPCKFSMNDSEPEKEVDHEFVDCVVGQKAFVSATKSQNQCKIPIYDSDYGVGLKAFVSAKKSQNQCKLSVNTSEKEIGHVVVDYGLGEGFEEHTTDWQKDDHERNVSLVNKTKQEADKLVVQLLARRAFTVVELRKKLHAKKFSSGIVEVVLNDFQGRGLINDCLYAETYSRSRWSSSSWGPQRIKHALSKKGVSKDFVEKAVTQVFSEGVEDEGLKFGLSKLSLDQLFVKASKQWSRSQGLPSETRKSRISRWLLYRGFDWDVINFILKKLQFQSLP